MSDIAELFELLHGADGSFHTVRATIRVWRDEEKQRRAFERHFEQEQEHGSGGISVMIAFGEPDEEPQTTTEEIIRVWVERPSRRREEVEGTYPRTSVTDGEKSWSYMPRWGAVEHETEGDEGGGEASFLFSPARLLPGLELELTGESELAGRQAIRVRAHPRSVGHHLIHFNHAPGADEYELLVDRERGVLLRSSAYIDGEEFATSEVTEIAFDEAFDPKIFTFEPPPGEAVRRPEDIAGFDHDVTIEDAAARASFVVWIPSELPRAKERGRFRATWEAEVMYQSGSDSPQMPEMVFVHYHHDDVGSISLNERKSEDEFVAKPPWEAVDHDDGRMFVWEPQESKIPMPTQIRVQREGTDIDLSSADLERDEFIAVARSLVPAPTQPPSFSS